MNLVEKGSIRRGLTRMPLWLRHQGYFENYGGVYNGVRNMLKKRLKAISQERLRNEFGEQNPK